MYLMFLALTMCGSIHSFVIFRSSIKSCASFGKQCRLFVSMKTEYSSLDREDRSNDQSLRRISSISGKRGVEGTDKFRHIPMHAKVNKSMGLEFSTSKPIKKRVEGKGPTSPNGEGVRINKCLPSLSRRAADEAVAAGRVTVNDVIITSAGFKVHRKDVVKLDGKKQYWESAIAAKQSTPAKEFDEQDFMYLKYWKPVGVTCTSDEKDHNNIISAGKFSLLPQRVFTVGRLDKESSGLILLTSDGRVNSAFLHRSNVKEKVYEVTTDRSISEGNIQQLRNGIMITTPVQRDHGGSRLVTAKTLPCKVTRLSPNQVTMTLVEGRNRQIRRMMDALGLKVVELLRVSFAGISLKGLSRPGKWKELSPQEMSVIQQALSSKLEDNKRIGNNSKSAKEEEELELDQDEA